MSFNQSMSEKNEMQYRKTSKSSNQQHRGFSPAYPTGAGASGPAPSISSNRSFKKSNNKAQGGQSRANVTNLNPSDAGASETTVTFAPPKQTEPSDPQRSSRAVPKAPASQSAFCAEEQDKQRQLKAILNKRITPQNFKKMFELVKAVNIDNAITLTGVVSQIYDKALMEPTFCETYAKLCFYLDAELPDFREDNEKITFKRLLVSKCQEEFERGEREQEEANKADEEGEVEQSEEEREEKRIKALRRMLGNIRLIGELYKKKMLHEKIMHECIKKLLGQHEQTPDEEDIEALCKLMSTIGEMIDHPKAKERMDAYFERIKSLSNNKNLSSRVRFMLQDTIDLRKNRWQKRRKVKGPKKKRKEILSKTEGAGVTSDLYGAYKNPEDKKNFASSVSVESTSTSIMSKQEAAGSSQQVAIVRDEGAPSKAVPDDWEDALGTSDSGEQDCGDKDGSGHGAKKYSRDFLLKFPMQLLDRLQGFEIMSEKHLRDLSLGAIKEFYSARDEKEVALCIKELNSPSFHPSMISLWVTDSLFERKDAERELLAKLLVNLTKSQDGTLSQSQLIKGFETVLSILEDAVVDAPRAPEFLGLIFARVILENVVSLNQIGQLIHELGGEEPGHLLEVGLAGNVLGNILEIIKSEKGESVLNEILTSSNLRLETFRPPDPLKSGILEKFI